MITRYLDFSGGSFGLSDTVERLLSVPGRLLQRSAHAFERHRAAALDRAALAALDQRLLADLGLKRSLIDPADLCRRPC
jgi:uncharacterized protein YjiS (DUF1127 family)